jgi:hypothetical protein
MTSFFCSDVDESGIPASRNRKEREMKNGISEVDHLMCGVNDPARANTAFEKLGFTVSPLSDMGLGLSNRCIVLTPATAETANYIELLGVTDPVNARPEIKAMVSGDEGIKQIMTFTPDARAAHAELESNGYELSPLLDFQRKWALPSGETVDLAFSVVLPVPGPAPFPYNLCQHHTVQHFHREDLRNHPNGARTLNSVYCVSENPEQDADFYESLFGKEAATSADGITTVGPGHVQMRLIAPHSLKSLFSQVSEDASRTPPYMAGLSVGVSDLRSTERYLAGSNVAFHTSPRGTLYVRPSQAHGILVEFEPLTE